ncbi:phosphoenolpyruvate mutase [Nocardiopsis sp. NRRL B-16309]|uniref:phosphoenolpyruvate mutase n=1 Tax=Nocardiopsis sp. NRRL B-16309 TaxID=1519494 RepID=UPI0006AEFE63|nr:phosphoenolpyruvate mutase [Nocardiopsis sp. NRRL B-16309]KOX14236.1 phosphoenolpyruvate phosphomutase [Nocardiopsis sp. NRRL B-16309]
MIIRSAPNELRRGGLRAKLDQEGFVRLIEAHDPLSAVVGEQTSVMRGRGVEKIEFDGFWSSSLTDSARRALPDIELVGIRSRLERIAEIFAVTAKPLLMDGDTGGRPEHFEFAVRDLERAGVSGVVIEDKTGLKQNSLLGTEVSQTIADIDEFSDKIARGRAARSGDDFMIVARLESLILELGMDDALKRASAYVDSGCDAIMIHSRRKVPDEVLEFAHRFRKSFPAVPLVSVPTSYNSINAEQLREAGFNVVIYANHMLRASMKAMSSVAESILVHDRTLEAEPYCSDVKDLLNIEVETPRTAAL